MVSGISRALARWSILPRYTAARRSSSVERMKLDSLKDEGAVRPTEAKRVRHGHVDLHRPRNVGHVVQIASWILIVQIDGRRCDLIFHTEQGENRLDAACGAEQMAGAGFGGTYRQLFCMVAKTALDGNRLRDVPKRR